MRGSSGELLIPLNAANLRIFLQISKSLGSFLSPPPMNVPRNERPSFHSQCPRCISGPYRQHVRTVARQKTVACKERQYDLCLTVYFPRMIQFIRRKGAW